MKLVLNPEQQAFRSSLERFVQQHVPMTRVREIARSKGEGEKHLWKQLAGELGLAGLTVPESHGGQGFGHVERSIVMEVLGSGLVPTRFLSTQCLAVDTLLAVDDEACRREWLPRIATGDTTATLAVEEGGTEWQPDRIATTASRHGDGWVLDGRKSLVIDGATADMILIFARTPDGFGFFLVTSGAAGLARTALHALDETRPLARIDLARTPARLVGCADPVGALARINQLATVALAAEQVGGMRRCVDAAVEYAKIRYQFGRPIGSFQAIKHLCADMHVAWELACSAMRYAAWAADESAADLPRAAYLAGAYCSEASFRVAADSIHVHGGIGFTWEHDAHLYFKRAKASERLFGSPQGRRSALAQHIGALAPDPQARA